MRVHFLHLLRVILYRNARLLAMKDVKCSSQHVILFPSIWQTILIATLHVHTQIELSKRRSLILQMEHIFRHCASLPSTCENCANKK